MIQRLANSLFLVAGLLTFHAAGTVYGQVTLTKGEHSVKVTVGDDVITVFEFGRKYAKPYFLPVTAPGAFAALQENLKKDLPEGSLGRQVYVCSEQAQLKVFGNVVGQVSQGEILTAGDVQGAWVWIPAKNGWIHRRDVAPLAGTVTRLVNDNPTPTKDKNSPLYYDHPHHKGLWISVDEVNEVQFWAEKGRIENQGVEIVTATGDPAVLKYVNHWLGEDGKPIVTETTTVKIFPNRLLAFDVHFTAGENAATFRDTKEGMFAIRLPNDMREFISGGPVTNAEGVSTTKELWGKPTAWIDYCGKLDGHTFGVTVMDHPENPRASRYHVRDYGLFALNPFGQKAYTNGQQEEAPLTIQPGDAGVTFRYALFVHDGDSAKEAITAAYNRFTSNP